jgi:hypothetical protein
MLTLGSCQPDEPPPIVEDTDRRTQFVGTYKVNNVSEPYTFTISKLDTLEQTWVKVNNFANMFDMKFRIEKKQIHQIFSFLIHISQLLIISLSINGVLKYMVMIQ